MKNFFTNIWVHIVFVFVLGFFIFGRLNGFCAGSLSIAPSAVPTFESFSSGMASGGFAWGNPVIMTTEALNNINTNLYQLYGYDLNDLVDDSWNSLITPSEWSNRLTQFVTGNATIDGNTISTSVADKIAQRISQGALTGAVTAKNLIDSGYAYFSTAVPQWGENAKQFFIGKRDTLTNEIVDVSPTMVTKITADGLMAYNQVYKNLVNSGDIHNMSSGGFLYGTNLVANYYLSSSTHVIFNVNLSKPCYFYSNGTAPANGYCFIDSSFLQYDSNSGTYFLPCSGFLNLNNSIYQLNYLVSSDTFLHSIDINGKKYLYGNFGLTETITGSWMTNLNNYPYQLGSFQDVIDNLSGNSSSAVSYDYYNSEFSIALKNQLDRLLDHYVDSLTLGRINDIVNELVIGRDVVDGLTVPVAKPTQEIVDELTGVIDDALELDEAYALAFDDAYAEPIDTTADPSPSFPKFPSGVPEEYVPPFLTDLFPSDMFSMFEPIFDIVGDQYSMFDTWLLIPAIFIFLFIFYVIISVL